MSARRVVFVGWLMGFRRRIWVGRVVRRGQADAGRGIWSASEAARIAAEMGRAG